ncbi:hypothetical protein FOCC_FOCC008501 [Frankliniella occidentalis]|nr:hypothetical protein FOCC_FOCC008501 [Frankliniella occidentalis]
MAPGYTGQDGPPPPAARPPPGRRQAPVPAEPLVSVRRVVPSAVRGERRECRVVRVVVVCAARPGPMGVGES